MKDKLEALKMIYSTCKKFCEWSESELEADMWIDIHNKTIKLKSYYEAYKSNN